MSFPREAGSYDNPIYWLPIRTEAVSKKAFLTAKFATQAQGSQRANCLFIKMLPVLPLRSLLLS